MVVIFTILKYILLLEQLQIYKVLFLFITYGFEKK